MKFEISVALHDNAAVCLVQTSQLAGELAKKLQDSAPSGVFHPDYVIII